MKNVPGIAVQIPDVLLPRTGIDMNKWAVIACDQYTSEPAYWKALDAHVGDSPSTLRLILPEVYLGKPGEEERINLTRQTMQEYLSNGVFVDHQGLILVERRTSSKSSPTGFITRHGLMMALDLEQYDYAKGSQTLIRATEGTIIDRLPPRMKIRRGAELELPHILVLIDDPEKTVIEPLAAAKQSLDVLYDLDLFADSGHLTGYAVNDSGLESACIQAITALAEPQRFAAHYGVDTGSVGVLLFAMGDGNHSLATAKAIWEELKPQVGMDHPARYALVEVENIHDEGLAFEPIHRILFHVKASICKELAQYYPGKVTFSTVQSLSALTTAVDCFDQPNQHCIGIIEGGSVEAKYSLAIIQDPETNLPTGTIQAFLDDWKMQDKYEEIDYIHGKDVLETTAIQPQNVGIYLPAMAKDELFRTVILDGALPRKTFSMGEAREKRFYFECRKIVI